MMYRTPGDVPLDDPPVDPMFTPLAFARRRERAEWRLSRIRVRRKQWAAKRRRHIWSEAQFSLALVGGLSAIGLLIGLAARFIPSPKDAPCSDRYPEPGDRCDYRADVVKDGDKVLCKCRREP